MALVLNWTLNYRVFLIASVGFDSNEGSIIYLLSKFLHIISLRDQPIKLVLMTCQLFVVTVFGIYFIRGGAYSVRILRWRASSPVCYFFAYFSSWGNMEVIQPVSILPTLQGLTMRPRRSHTGSPLVEPKDTNPHITRSHSIRNRRRKDTLGTEWRAILVYFDEFV